MKAPCCLRAFLHSCLEPPGRVGSILRQRDNQQSALRSKIPGSINSFTKSGESTNFIEETVVGTLELIADICVWFDKWIVDGILSQVTSFIVAFAGSLVRLFQTGRVQTYAAFIVLGLGCFGWFFTTPHAEAAVSKNHETGKYTITAEPGLGYVYRWDTNGDGQFETNSFGNQLSVNVELARTERRTITLQVRDTFGRESTQKFRLERPAEDQSGYRAVQAEGAPDANAQPQKAPGGSAAPGRDIQPGQLQ